MDLISLILFWSLLLIGGVIGLIVALLAITAFVRLWRSHPVPEPVYDRSVRVKPSRAPQIIMGLIVIVWIISLLAQAGGLI